MPSIHLRPINPESEGCRKGKWDPGLCFFEKHFLKHGPSSIVTANEVLEYEH